MKLEIIYTDRFFQNWPTWPLIYEWEDELAEAFDLKLVNSGKASVTTFYADRILRFTSRKLFGDNRLIIFADKLINKKKAIYFELLTRKSFYFTGSKNTLPIIIDYWKTIDRDLFYKAYANCRAVLISNKEAYNFLKACNCPLNIYHFPQSIADKYRINPDKPFNKIYDIVIPGRVDSVLWGFLQEYEKKFPGVQYMYRKDIDGEFFYVSNLTGEAVRAQTRDEYMHLLQSSKIAFYSTVGIDGDEVRTGGFSPMTPRFLEMVSAGCKVIARYPQNAETEFFEADKICTSCNTYAIFEKELSKALNEPGPDLNFYAKYLDKHYTSKRAELLKGILEQI